MRIHAEIIPARPNAVNSAADLNKPP